MEIYEDYILFDNIRVSYYLPGIKLIFDYQKDNFYGLNNSSGNIKVEIKYHENKERVAKEKGLDIVLIPFWWNRTVESLIATIKKKHKT